MCTKNVFSPVNPCCQSQGLCQAWPAIDWNKYTWLTRIPSARLAEERRAGYLYDGSRGTFIPEEFDPAASSYIGSVPQYQPGPPKLGDVVSGPVYAATYAFHARGGEFISRYSGGCKWFAKSKEKLCPGALSIVFADNPAAEVQTWYARADHVLQLATGDPDFGDWGALGQFNGKILFEYPTSSANPDYFVSWRRVFQAAECTWLPAIRSAGWEWRSDSTIDGGLKSRLEAAAARLENPSEAPISVIRPTAMDFAIEWTRTVGLEFGIESARDSPFFGQFVIFEGSEFAYVTVEDVRYKQEMISTPWNLVSGEAVVAQAGIVNRFERLDDNDTLPAWIELELIRI